MNVHTAYWPAFGASEGSPSGLGLWLSRVWQGVLAHLDVSEEPRVWQSPDQGNAPLWNAYDPVTGQSVHLVSEAELRTWLEDLHYREQRIAEERQTALRLMWHY